MIVYWKYKIWYERFKLYINLKHQTSVPLFEVPITHSRHVQILIYLFDLSPRKRFVYLLEIVDHICCFFVGWGLGHVKSLRFLYYRVDFFNHLIIILPVLGHWQKLYFFSALWKRRKKTLHIRLFSETIADSPLLNISSLHPRSRLLQIRSVSGDAAGRWGNGAVRLGKLNES